MKAIINEQVNIWDQKWQEEARLDPAEILYSRFAQEAFKCIRTFIDDKEEKIILEAGCGTGRISCLIAKNYPNCKVTGLDISQKSLSVANILKEYAKTPNINFSVGDLFKMPYPDNCFDVVFNEGVIEHFPLDEKLNYKGALREMIRVTKPKGKIIIAVPNWYCFPHTFYKWALKKLGKKHIYGYEKSFKHNEMIQLFSEFNLINLEISAFYPSHGYYRLAGKGPKKIFYYLGKIMDYILSLNQMIDRKITKQNGFEILIKGLK